MQRDATSSCRSRPRRCYGSGLAAGEDILLDDRVNAPISIHHLGDAEVDANRNQGDRLILGQLLGCHQKFAHFPERIAQSKVDRRLLSNWETLARLLVAAALGSLIGFERERLLWAAGIRTHMLVCVGACLFMIVSAFRLAAILSAQHALRDPS